MTVEAVVEEIIFLLRQCGEDGYVAWLEQKLLALRTADSSSGQGRSEVLSDLHGVVLGMGGLMDLTLRPLSSSRMTSTFARERLDRLSDQLYELTRDS